MLPTRLWTSKKLVVIVLGLVHDVQKSRLGVLEYGHDVQKFRLLVLACTKVQTFGSQNTGKTRLSERTMYKSPDFGFWHVQKFRLGVVEFVHPTFCDYPVD